MKTLSEITKQMEKDMQSQPQVGVIVEFINVLGGWKKLNEPTLSTNLVCPICEKKSHYTPLVDPAKGAAKVWMCMDGGCEAHKSIRKGTPYHMPTQTQRALQWPLFCEINGIGDVNHNVIFDDIRQSEEKLGVLLKFANKPVGCMLMSGKPGTGKTFASMGLCELYTRKSTSCIFTTHKQMLGKWLDTFKPDNLNRYIEKVSTTELLVIDDFGIAESSPAFMSFFFDLLNTRLQWTNRGTVITTNLEDAPFTAFCGQALTDRIRGGKLLDFRGNSRRF